MSQQPNKEVWLTVRYIFGLLAFAALAAFNPPARAESPPLHVRVEPVSPRAVLLSDWTRRAFTGEQRLGAGRLRSRDGRWTLTLTPIDGLDVASFKISLIGTPRRPPQGGTLIDTPGRHQTPPPTTVSEQALEATFSPDSRWLFVSTGPHPFLYDLGRHRKLVLTSIDSGIESRPVWAWSWKSASGQLVLHQQSRFDKRSDLRAYTVDMPRP